MFTHTDIIFTILSVSNSFQFIYHNVESVRQRFDTNRANLLHPRHCAMRRAYVVHFGFGRQAFDVLFGLISQRYRNHHRTGRLRSLGADLGLALVLMWLHNTMKYETLYILFGVTISSVSRTKILGMQILEDTFRQDPSNSLCVIHWPTPREMETFNDMILSNTLFANEADAVHGAFGFIDGLNLSI
ncbi:hypothetical protein MBANPS3_011033 [Mucor bainieri]